MGGDPAAGFGWAAGVDRIALLRERLGLSVSAKSPAASHSIFVFVKYLKPGASDKDEHRDNGQAAAAESSPSAAAANTPRDQAATDAGMNDRIQSMALQLVSALRRAGFVVDHEPLGSITAQMSRQRARSATTSLFVGPNEVNTGTVVLRNSSRQTLTVSVQASSAGSASEYSVKELRAILLQNGCKPQVGPASIDAVDHILA